MKLLFDSELRNIAGSRIKIARIKNNLTQEELSAKLEILAVYINRSGISKIEQGKRIITDFELVAFSRVLKVSVSWLLGLD